MIRDIIAAMVIGGAEIIYITRGCASTFEDALVVAWAVLVRARSTES